MANLHKLRELLGDDGPSIQRFLDLLHEQIPRLTADLQEASSRQDWSLVSIHAHTLKSNLRYLGADAAAELAFQVEQDADNQQNTEKLPALVGQLATQAVAALG